MLESNFELHRLVNDAYEVESTRADPQDFDSLKKVDNHIHVGHAAVLPNSHCVATTNSHRTASREHGSSWHKGGGGLSCPSDGPYCCRDSGTELQAASAMTRQEMLAFLRTKVASDAETVVLVTKTGEATTLRDALLAATTFDALQRKEDIDLITHMKSISTETLDVAASAKVRPFFIERPVFSECRGAC